MIVRKSVRAGRRLQAGWTLIEAMAVMLTLAIVSAVILYKAADRTDYDLYSQTEVIKNHLRHAQNLAMNSDTRYGLHFQSADQATTYGLYRVTPGPPETEVPQAMGGEAASISMPPGVWVSGPSPDFYLSFDNWGTLYHDQNPSTSHPNIFMITVSGAGGSTVSITIHPNTGFIP